MTEAAALAEWLQRIEQAHPKAIELGLERVAQVRDRLGIAKWCPIIIVGGTNGKGSTAAMLESILLAAGYRVGLYTSPHLVDYAERVRVDGRNATASALVAGFERVEAARGTTPLTYFEFGTLGAWVVFAAACVDVLVLEVGLGGRLDAVNAFEPDGAVLTSVGLDHQDYLGTTREAIGWEKAHIFRAGRPAIIAEPDPPASVLEHARAIGADVQRIGHEFGYVDQGMQWRFWSPSGRRSGLAPPALRGANQLGNASGALAVLGALRERLPVSANAVRSGLATVALPGRFQVLPGRPSVILDVAHNPQAASVLAANLAASAVASGPFRATVAVFGMLRDKDIAGVVRAVRREVDRWHVVGLPGPRGTTSAMLAAAVLAADPIAEVVEHPSVAAALACAREAARPDDRIVVFGSFLTVADAIGATAAGAGPAREYTLAPT